MTLTLRYAVRSDLGLVRGNNEDSVYAGPRLLAIADGMGGHAAGEVASKIVIGTLEPLDDVRVPGDLITALREAVMESNVRIADAVEADPDLDGMGTTLTALRFAGSQVALVHVGDSRAYLLRDQRFEQITHDDTYVQYLVDSGKLTPEEAKDHPRKSVILRALRGAEVEPDVAIREAHAGDRYLLCSDGLSDVVSSETIAEALRIPDPQECADRLVELALRSGGPDNVTVIVSDVVDSRPGDVVDDVPVRDGAFVDPAAARTSPADSAAERAAAMSRPQPAAVAEEPTPRRRPGWWKTPAIVVGILALIAAGIGGTYVWAQTQYYVGTAGGEVAIYKGVKASFGPLKFSEVYENSDLLVTDLNTSWQAQVESGIPASSRSDAEAIVVRLHDEQKPLCSSLTRSPTATTAPPTTLPPTTRPTVPTSSRPATPSASRNPATGSTARTGTASGGPGSGTGSGAATATGIAGQRTGTSSVPPLGATKPASAHRSIGTHSSGARTGATARGTTARAGAALLPQATATGSGGATQHASAPLSPTGSRTTAPHTSPPTTTAPPTTPSTVATTPVATSTATTTTTPIPTPSASSDYCR